MLKCADCGKEMEDNGWDYQSPFSDKYFCEDCVHKPMFSKSKTTGKILY